MKLLVIPLAFSLGILSVIVLLALRTDDPNGKTVLNIAWDGPYALKVPSSEVTVDSLGHKTLTIRPLLTADSEASTRGSTSFASPIPPSVVDSRSRE